jgi:hypothetical protein
MAAQWRMTQATSCPKIQTGLGITMTPLEQRSLETIAREAEALRLLAVLHGRDFGMLGYLLANVVQEARSLLSDEATKSAEADEPRRQ